MPCLSSAWQPCHGGRGSWHCWSFCGRAGSGGRAPTSRSDPLATSKLLSKARFTQAKCVMQRFLFESPPQPQAQRTTFPELQLRGGQRKAPPQRLPSSRRSLC